MNLKVFGRSVSWIETVFNGTLTYIYEQRRDFLYWDAQRLTAEQLQIYCDAIDAPGNRIYGFIDGTHRAICRPSTMDQKFFYSGYKKVHSVKFQAIMTPDGLIIHLAGCLSIYYSLIIPYFICLFICLYPICTFNYYFYFYSVKVCVILVNNTYFSRSL